MVKQWEISAFSIFYIFIFYISILKHIGFSLKTNERHTHILSPPSFQDTRILARDSTALSGAYHQRVNVSKGGSCGWLSSEVKSPGTHMFFANTKGANLLFQGKGSHWGPTESGACVQRPWQGRWGRRLWTDRPRQGFGAGGRLWPPGTGQESSGMTLLQTGPSRRTRFIKATAIGRHSALFTILVHLNNFGWCQ